MQMMLWGQDGMPSHAMPPPGTSAVGGDSPGVASSWGHPNELPFLLRPWHMVRVEGTVFRIGSGFWRQLFICARWRGAQSRPGKWQLALRCIPAGSV